MDITNSILKHAILYLTICYTILNRILYHKSDGPRSSGGGSDQTQIRVARSHSQVAPKWQNQELTFMAIG